MFRAKIYPYKFPFWVAMIKVAPSAENSILETFPKPTGKSKVSYLIYFQSLSRITLILFSPARASLLYELLIAID